MLYYILYIYALQKNECMLCKGAQANVFSLSIN